MQKPTPVPYTVDELKKVIGAGIREYNPSVEVVHTLNVLNHLVNECSFTFVTMTDYSMMKFFFVSPGIEQVIGYPYEMIVNGGLEFMFSLQHPDETESLRLIHKQIAAFFHSLPANDKLNYSYAYDVRLRKADSAYIRLLCQLDCVELGADGHLSAGREMYTDITPYDSFSHIKLVISRHDQPRGTSDIVYHFDLSHPDSKLSKREKEVHDLVSQGLRSKEIGEKLHISKYTVDTYRQKIRKKEKKEE